MHAQPRFFDVLLSNNEWMYAVPGRSVTEVMTYAPQAWARMFGERITAVFAVQIK